MSEPSTPPPSSTPARLRWLWRLVNVLVPLALGFAMINLGLPRDELREGSRARRVHDALVEKLRKVSISQTWRMYAPDPARGHFYMVMKAHDQDGTERMLEESVNADQGWGTTWAWKRTRMDIWQHSVMRRIDEVNRNRTWYMRGVCMREARRGYDVRRLEMGRVYRRIRPPDKVRAGKAVLSKRSYRKGQDTSCRVKVIRDMIALDREQHPERYPQEPLDE